MTHTHPPPSDKLNGRMERRDGGRKDEWLVVKEVWVDEWKDGEKGGREDEWEYGRMNGKMERREGGMDGWREDRRGGGIGMKDEWLRARGRMERGERG